MSNGKEPCSVSLGSDTLAMLKSISAADMVSVSSIVERAVWEYCARRFVSTQNGRSNVLHGSSISENDV